MKGLPEEYLQYPHRRRGMDHDIYPFRALPSAKQVIWPNGARIALCVAVHMGHFPMDMPQALLTERQHLSGLTVTSDRTPERPALSHNSA